MRALKRVLLMGGGDLAKEVVHALEAGGASVEYPWGRSRGLCRA